MDIESSLIGAETECSSWLLVALDDMDNVFRLIKTYFCRAYLLFMSIVYTT